MNEIVEIRIRHFPSGYRIDSKFLKDFIGTKPWEDAVVFLDVKPRAWLQPDVEFAEDWLGFQFTAVGEYDTSEGTHRSGIAAMLYDGDPYDVFGLWLPEIMKLAVMPTGDDHIAILTAWEHTWSRTEDDYSGGYDYDEDVLLLGRLDLRNINIRGNHDDTSGTETEIRRRISPGEEGIRGLS